MAASNGVLVIRDTTMDYIRFGCGKKTLVMLPGLGDGLRTVKGSSLPLSLLYRKLASEFTVFACRRVNDLPEGYSTVDMAKDQIEAMGLLGIRNAAVLGVSMGGMIAQHVAIEEPSLVDALVLVVTSAEPHPALGESVEEWVSLARRGDHVAFMDSNLKRMYTERY
ncbi:MAG: alpha/beta fold hydrolase, partial [Eggerthellaceae bacterium]|nr:alpha/beta fold hydrolase [Eggerthellaceae bacterium]